MCVCVCMWVCVIICVCFFLFSLGGKKLQRSRRNQSQCFYFVNIDRTVLCSQNTLKPHLHPSNHCWDRPQQANDPMDGWMDEYYKFFNSTLLNLSNVDII